jgi:hypothetical protein
VLKNETQAHDVSALSLPQPTNTTTIAPFGVLCMQPPDMWLIYQ